jgi:hypothetical protein
MGPAYSPEFLQFASPHALESLEQALLNQAANCRKHRVQAIDTWVEAEVQARLAQWALRARRTQPSVEAHSCTSASSPAIAAECRSTISRSFSRQACCLRHAARHSNLVLLRRGLELLAPIANVSWHALCAFSPLSQLSGVRRPPPASRFPASTPIRLRRFHDSLRCSHRGPWIRNADNSLHLVVFAPYAECLQCVRQSSRTRVEVPRAYSSAAIVARLLLNGPSFREISGLTPTDAMPHLPLLLSFNKHNLLISVP